MTYGWAILAIAIVMVSLYSLGIFNTGNLQPTATPGSCKVVRTTAQTSLAGQCSNLVPKYIGKFDDNGYVSIPSSSNLGFAGSVTMTAWVNIRSYKAYPQYSTILEAAGGSSSYMLRIGGNVGNTVLVYVEPGLAEIDSNLAVNPNALTFVAASFTNNSNVLFYVGSQQQTVSTSLTLSSHPDVGYYISDTSSDFFNGSIANVQIYNTSLDSASLKALYQEGIGGAPIDLRHLVGWWPLNGNANDYSGNNNQGTPTNVIWSANWQSGYSAPS